MKYKIIAVIFLIFFLGCETGEGKKSVADEKKNYKINVIDEKELEKIINERSGKVLFINVWATWCIPCIEEFPDLVKIDEYYKGKDVDIISLNVDFGPGLDSLVISFLEKQNAGFTVFNVKEKSSENIINLLNPEWNGAIPATFIFDKNGKRIVYIPGNEKFPAFRNAIDSVRSL